ncbi:MAG TPA: acetate kinase [Bacilli bacterium]|jgi:acetate kinase|nr:acetate kinase [Bacilli bacterium]HQC83519.1 acetate kinase [Bacilli bacterium]
MKILSVNAGSSSLKFQLFEMPEENVLISGVFERIGIDGSFYTIKLNGEKTKKECVLKNHEDAVKVLIDELVSNKVIKSLDEIEGVGHRLVHGGEKYSESVIIDDEVVKTVEELSPLAPLHNPANLMGVKAFQTKIPSAKQVGCFDTAFHQTMKEDRYLYAVPYEWYTKYGIRKYGFHGMSHRYVSERANELLDKNYTSVIVCHLGNGGSISAIRDGRCVDTTMGFTPNAGIVMGSRSGDIDYSIIPYLMNKTGKTVEEIDTDLNKASGMLGISGVSSDFRDIDEAIAKKNHQAILAHYLYVNSIVNYVARFYVELGGCDAICFTAGVGENAPHVRRMVLDRLSCLGIKIDKQANEEIRFGKEGLITKEDSSVPCYVIPTNEELMIARDTYNLIK